LTLDGLLFAQNRLSAGHPAKLLLAAKQASVEAGIGGEERVAEIFRKHPFPFEHHIFHDLSPSLDEKFQIDTFCLTPWHGVILEVKNIAGVLEFKNNPPQLMPVEDRFPTVEADFRQLNPPFASCSEKGVCALFK
jgi:Nuclease-related domain